MPQSLEAILTTLKEAIELAATGWPMNDKDKTKYDKDGWEWNFTDATKNSNPEDAKCLQSAFMKLTQAATELALHIAFVRVGEK